MIISKTFSLFNGTSKMLALAGKVIRRIETKSGVYVDDLSDYGVNLGKTKHANAPPIEQIQKEVLMEEGLFKQVSDPIPFTGSDGSTWYYIDFVELGKPLK